MDHIMHRTMRGKLPLAVGGDGPYVIDAEGKRYLDASGGAAVSCLGYRDEEVITAIKEQLDKVPFVHSGFFTTPVMEELGDEMIAKAPQGMDRVYLVSGGSEAMESALKLARQYMVEKGEPQRRYFIAREQSYHGNTLGALAVGGNKGRRALFDPLLIEAHHIPPCYAYRHQRDYESESQYGLRAADALEEKIQELGAENVIAFVAETVVGATAGVIPPAEGYFRRIREICDRHGILLILDEVMSGMARTGTLHACEQDGVAPDLMAVAKGLGAGYQPIGGLYISGKISQVIEQGSGFFQHGHTYMGHASAAAAALTVHRKISRPETLAQIRATGEALDKALRDKFDNHPHVGDIRGRGLFRGIELVRERADKSCFDPALKFHARIKARAMEAGLMCYPGGGGADGERGDHILLAPSFIIGEPQVAEIADRLGKAVDMALEDIRA